MPEGVRNGKDKQLSRDFCNLQRSGNGRFYSGKAGLAREPTYLQTHLGPAQK